MDSAQTMEPAVRRGAEELGRALRQTEAYHAWQQALQTVQEHEAARVMWEDLQRRVAQLEAKVRAGQTVTEEERRQTDELIKLAAYNPYVRDLLVAQEGFVAMVLAAHQAVDQSLGLTPTGAGEAGPATATAASPAAAAAPPESPPSSSSARSGPDVAVAKSKLWIPGQS